MKCTSTTFFLVAVVQRVLTTRIRHNVVNLSVSANLDVLTRENSRRELWTIRVLVIVGFWVVFSDD